VYRRDDLVTVRKALQRAIRPSTTRGIFALWAKSLLNAVLFFGIFMVALPAVAHYLLPMELAVPRSARVWLAGMLALAGGTAWISCLDAFSRHGRGTPLPADAPRKLVTTGLFSRVRNPIMVAELLVIWAVALSLSSLGVFLYAVAICIAAHLAVVHVEEPELRQRFGAQYEEYCRSVPRWFPRFGNQKKTG
jgi:protein-S-isoprenylcysteine O-methyltransferase Ste14